MTFELFRFANLVVTMSFVTDSDYDACCGLINVTDGSCVYQYWQEFHSAKERNTAMAEALRISAKLLEEL